MQLFSMDSRCPSHTLRAMGVAASASAFGEPGGPELTRIVSEASMRFVGRPETSRNLDYSPPPSSPTLVSKHPQASASIRIHPTQPVAILQRLRRPAAVWKRGVFRFAPGCVLASSIEGPGAHLSSVSQATSRPLSLAMSQPSRDLPEKHPNLTTPTLLLLRLSDSAGGWKRGAKAPPPRGGFVRGLLRLVHDRK